MPLAALALGFAVAARPAGATDLSYTLMSPNFGGTNGVALQMAGQAKGLQAAQAQAQAQAAAAAEAAATASSTAAAGGTANLAFLNSIVSQLTGIVAYKIATEVANSTPGQAGTINANGSTITYINQDGQLAITVTSPAGSTTLSVPTGN
jgi:hypothetical protein